MVWTESFGWIWKFPKQGNDYDVVTITDLPGWNPNSGQSESELIEINRNWIRKLKEEGCTFYDLGFDPNFKTVSNSEFYNMELFEIFDGVNPPWPAIQLQVP